VIDIDITRDDERRRRRRSSSRVMSMSITS